MKMQDCQEENRSFQKKSALSIDMTQKEENSSRYGVVKVEVIWSGAQRNGKVLQLSALADIFSLKS